MINIFIGYDDREAIVYHVCSNSILRHASEPVSITPLTLNSLKGYTETHSDGSNKFIYSRFLVPFLMKYGGWALFIDGDMILRGDISELWKLRDPNKAILVVKHDYKTKATEKYLGSKNENYPRKNWSSVVLWNCSHPANYLVTPDFVMSSSGAQLHRFTWLTDDLIGELPITWNWLPDEFGENSNANLLHWTLGAPCFHEYSTAPMSSEWHRELIFASLCKQSDIQE
jgi:lipopolysaccharide biosynthesis glycosyltransferase